MVWFDKKKKEMRRFISIFKPFNKSERDEVKNYQLPELLFLGLIFVTFFYNKLAPIFIVAFMVSLIFYKSRRQLNWRANHFFKSPMGWMCIFFVMHIIGLVWTENYAFAWSDIGMKLSFLLFPVIFFTFKIKINFQTFIQFFIASMVIIVSILLIHAAFKSIYYPEDNHWAYFFESEFTGRMHRSYFATYTAITSVFSLLIFMKNGKKKFYLFSFILMTVATVLTISKAGILILILCLLLVFIHRMIQLKKWIFLALGSVSIIVGIILLVSLSERVSSRFMMISKAISEIKLRDNPDSESNEARLIMWNTSIQLIKGYPILGAGTGDVKDALIAKNIEIGNTGVAEKKLNAHNQYLNTWVQIGVFGFVSLLMIFTFIFYIAKKEKNMYLFYFGLILFLSLLTESFLETQAGIIPFGLLSFAILSTRVQID